MSDGLKRSIASWLACILFAAGLFCLSHANALVGPRRALLSGRGGLPPPIAELNFAQSTYSGTCATTFAQCISFTRALAAYAQNIDGTYTLFSTGVPRVTNRGFLIENQRTNSALQNRDLTNATWNTKTNATIAHNQVGFDGTSNSASLVSATAAGTVTVTQSGTVTSTSRIASLFIKGVTVSGTISATYDGSTFTTLNSSICVDPFGNAINISSSMTSFARCTLPAQTITAMVIGVRLANTGGTDSIVVDCVQAENSSSDITSCIPTTTTAVTRPTDLPILQNGADTIMTGANGTIVIASASIPKVIATARLLSNGASVSRFILANATNGGILSADVNNVNTITTLLDGSGSYAGVAKTALRWGPSTRGLVGGGGSIVNATTGLGSVPAGTTGLGLSSASTAAGPDGYITDMRMFNYQLTDIPFHGETLQ